VGRPVVPDLAQRQDASVAALRAEIRQSAVFPVVLASSAELAERQPASAQLAPLPPDAARVAHRASPAVRL